ncbi:MAG TPA: hypothetical protein VK031_06670 [Tissierellaceae bacterium]|nr:hypothetical protein [Tissierellaceae bacterium]
MSNVVMGLVLGVVVSSFIYNYPAVKQFKEEYKELDNKVFLYSSGALHSHDLNVIMYRDKSIDVKGREIRSGIRYKLDPYTYYWYMKYRYYLSRQIYKMVDKYDPR